MELQRSLKLALECEGVDKIDLVAERILGDAFLLEEKLPLFVGVLLKEACAQLSSEIEMLKGFLRELTALVEGGEERYTKYLELFVEYAGKSKAEGELYVGDEVLSERLVKGLISFMYAHRRYLYTEKTGFVEGLAREMGRILDTYGGSLESYLNYIHLKTLSRLVCYFYHESYTTTGEFRSDYLKGKVLEYAERLLQLNREMGGTPEFLDMIIEEIIKITKEWRGHMLIYPDVERR